MRKNLLIFILLLLTGVSGYSQVLWTLDDCIRYAEENNIALKRQSLVTEQRKSDLLANRATVLPNLNLQSQGRMNFGRSVDPVTNTITFNKNMNNFYSLSTNVGLFNGFATVNRISAARYLYYMGQEQEEQLNDLLSLDIVNAFYNVLLAKGVVKTAIEQLEVSKKQMRNMEVLVETGAESRTTLLEVQSQVSYDKLLLTQARNNAIITIEDLKLLLQLKPGTDFDIKEDMHLMLVDIGSTVKVDSLYTSSKNVLPRIKLLEYQALARKKELAATKGEATPSLGMFAGWQTGYYDAMMPGIDPVPFTEQIKNNNNQFVGLSLNIPIFNRWLNQNNIKRAKINLNDANLQLEQEYNLLYQEVNAACIAYVSVKDEYLSANDNLEFNKLSFEAVNKKFTTGLANATEFAESKRQLFSAEIDLLRTRLQYNLKTITINFYRTGKWAE